MKIFGLTFPPLMLLIIGVGVWYWYNNKEKFSTGSASTGKITLPTGKTASYSTTKGNTKVTVGGSPVGSGTRIITK